MITQYEVKVLREAAGRPQPDLVAGAALWAALGVLRGLGLVRAEPENGALVYRVTQAGLEYLAEVGE